MSIRSNITKRRQRRKQRDGSVKTYDRWVLNYTCPKTDERHQRFFERQKDAQAAQRELVLDYDRGFGLGKANQHTVADAFDLWLESCRGHVKPRTFEGYESFRPIILGPLLLGSDADRRLYTRTGKVPAGCRLKPMLGMVKISELTTADIRTWHNLVAELVGAYTARRASQRLKAMLQLAAEDFNLRPPSMPQRLGRGRKKAKKAILKPEQVRVLLEHCQQDEQYGLYVAWPFLTGTRPSEQLAVHWEDIDFEKGVIHIRRMLEQNGTITQFTKTEAGMREVPMVSMLKQWLLEWRMRCPRKNGELKLVFPSHGARQAWPKRKVGGGVLLYSNFRSRVWKKAFEALAEQGLPYVTPHSARHCFISTLQAQGVEVGLVAKFAGHSDPSVTLSHYTQAVRDGSEAIEKLAIAFS